MATFVPSCDIVVGLVEWDFVTEVKVDSSFESLTDTCTITIPKKVSFEGKSITEGDNAIFKPKDLVNVLLGYNGRFNTAFNGFLKRVKVGTPLVLECEDSMTLLKESNFTKSYKNITLKQLLSDMLPSVKIVAADTNLGQWRVSNVSPAKILASLKDDFGLYAWFRDGVLYCGTPYLLSASYRKTHAFHLYGEQGNVVNSDSLEYKRNDESKYKVKAISIQSDNKRIEAEVGDAEGEQRTLHFYNLDLAALKEAATRELESIKKEGYEGSFVAFGTPFVRHGDAVKLFDPVFPEREGTYLVKRVVYTFGTSGYRQEIFLDRKLS